MRKSASKTVHRSTIFEAKGSAASLLRRRKYELVRSFDLPADLLGGSLTLTQRRCGKAGCRCASGDGHPMWTLTYSVEDDKQVLVVPAADVALLQPLVEQGRRWRDALSELLAINAQLLSLWRQQQRQRAGRRRTSKRHV
jgi:hypothetical protein